MTDDGVDWEAVRTAYEGGDDSLAGLAARYGVDRSRLARRARRDGWIRSRPETAAVRAQPGAGRRAPPTAASLVKALQRTTARLVVVMEARLARAGEDVEEKDLRALGALAGTLSKVIALAAAERPERDRDPDGPSERRDPAKDRGDGDDGGRPLDFDDPALLDALSHRLERLATERAGGLPASAQPERTGELGAILADLRAGGPTGPTR